MRGGYESLTWLNDNNGREFVCYSDDINDKNNFEDLTEEERKNCDNVNQLVGTERW